MIVVEAASHLFHPLRDGDELPPLDARLAAVCREKYRRIDRFVQLALVGAGECVAGRAVQPACGLYLSSSIGPIGSNAIVQQSIHRDAKLPMPFNFVNTLGTSAGYHVAKHLDLTSEAIFVSRRGASFEAALACAVADLLSGVASQMLVAAVEECTVPLSRHRELLQLPPSCPLAEGSHWMLLARGDAPGRVVPEGELHDASFDGYESRGAARLTSFVQRHADQRFGLTWSLAAGAQLVALD